MEAEEVCGWAFSLEVRDGTGVSVQSQVQMGVQVRMVVPMRNGRHRHTCKRRADHKLEGRARQTLVVLVSPLQPLRLLLVMALHRPSLPRIHPPTRYHPDLRRHNHPYKG